MYARSKRRRRGDGGRRSFYLAEKSNEIPTAPELIEALKLTGCLFTLDAEHCQKKLFERVIASGNHLLTQVKDNQPHLRRRLELGAGGRKPSGFAKSQTKGCNRWETRELTIFPAKAWFRYTPWEQLIKTVLRLERTVCRRDSATGLCKQTTGSSFGFLRRPAQRRSTGTKWIRGHWSIENGSHCVRDSAFAEDASRIRKNPDIVARLRSFAYNLLRAKR